MEMSAKLADAADKSGIPAKAIDREKAEEILARSKVGAAAVPGLVSQATLGGEE